MTPTDEIISMAREARKDEDVNYDEFVFIMTERDLTRFAALVSARAAAIEREKNAIRCDAIGNRYNKPDEAGYRIAAEWCAAEIRSAK